MQAKFSSATESVSVPRPAPAPAPHNLIIENRSSVTATGVTDVNKRQEQEFVKDGDLTVEKYTQKTAKELGGDIKITRFVRFAKGEGLEKREDNFAAEVASMMG